MAQERDVPAGLLGRIEALIDRKIAAFARSGFLRNASISGGAGLTIKDGGRLTVTDAEGDRRVHLGGLEDGSYGLAVFDDDGRPLSLAQVAFGLAAAAADDPIMPARNEWVDDPDLSVPVTVTTGRMVVIVSAQIIAGAGGTGTPSTGWYGYRLSGAAVRPPEHGRALLGNYAGSGMEAITQASWWDVHTGLRPGDYVVTPAMFSESMGSPANDCEFSFRRVTVLPY